MSDNSKNDSENNPAEEEGVVRSSGAAQQEGYSPLLSRLLEETMRDAEREKEDLDSRIREKEAEERRKQEEEAIARRLEMQRRVEEEQKKRDAMLRPSPAAESAAAAEAVDTGVSAAEPASRSGAMIPWVLLLLTLGGAGYLYMQEAQSRETADGTIESVSERLRELDGVMAKELKAAPSATSTEVTATLGALGNRVEQVLEDRAALKRELDSATEKLKASQASAEELGKKQAELTAALETAQETQVQLQTQIETLMATPARKRRIVKKPTAAPPKPSGKVKVNTDIFNSNMK